MSKLQHALDLAALGYHVFPLEVGSKLPHIDAFQKRASRDPEQIKSWWTDPVLGIEQDFNIGISTSAFGDNQALLVVDIDIKEGKHGDSSLVDLQLEYGPLPDTLVATTASGGKHYYFTVDEPLRQSAGTLGSGIDTRSRGGFVVAPGSEISNNKYAWSTDQRTPSPAPAWLVERFRVDPVAVPGAAGSRPAQDFSVDAAQAIDRATSYLNGLDVVTQGERNHKGYATAAYLKDLGVPQDQAAALLLEHWKCDPMLDLPELDHVVKSAYRYGANPPGSAAPESQFTPLKGRTDAHEASGDGKIPSSGDQHPFQILNKEFAFVLAGGGSHILWETVDANARAKLEHLNLTAFNQKFASWTMQIGKRNEPVTELWMKDRNRRGYDGLCFRPGLTAPERFYNLWRGFTVQPMPLSTMGGHMKSVDMLLEHCRINVCGDNELLFKWLIGYFAHMIQKPWEKPLVALVFRGGKGVGKSAVVERVGHLLGNHFLSTSNRRFLVSNFNGHLENNLFFVLEEAFWSGDKQAEGTLKDLITGATHVIEHKGKETFTVDNRTRIAIIGNEDWLVPASHDERRFAVFDVGDARKQDRAFFTAMRVGMECGGYGALLTYLQNYDLAGLDFDDAPTTQGLRDQKEESLDPIHAWWLECLTEGRIVGSDFDAGWPEEVSTDRFRSGYQRYAKERNVRSWMPDANRISRQLKKCIPGWRGRQRARDKDAVHSVYLLPPLVDCRTAWEQFIGHGMKWE